MGNTDIRWQQRFSNYKRALVRLGKFLQKKDLNELEEQGLIQVFECTHELAWRALSDFLKSKGNLEIYGSKDASREAFSLGIIEDGEVWMEMIKSRNLTSHTYNEQTTKQIIKAITGSYYNAFVSLEKRLDAIEK